MSVTYDGNYTYQSVITGDDPILEYTSNSLFIAGRSRGSSSSSTDGSLVEEGYHGCLQDVRFNQKALPTGGANEIASIVFVGDSPEAGCKVGPCYPNPCGSNGNCSELSDSRYQCKCSGGQVVTQSSCDPDTSGTGFEPIAIAIALAVFIMILIIALIVGLTVIFKRYKKSKKIEQAEGRFLNNISASSLNEFEIHENIYCYDNEDGEEDTAVNELTGQQPNRSREQEQTNQRQRSSRESLPQENSSGDEQNNLPPIPSVSTLERGRNSDKMSVNPSPSLGHRASTPEIDAFIESRVTSANNEVSDIDSMRCYTDEGVMSNVSSLSTICSDTGYEPYTVTQLRLAGPEFERIADLLEPVLVEDSNFDETGSDQHINIALVHDYK